MNTRPNKTLSRSFGQTANDLYASRPFHTSINVTLWVFGVVSPSWQCPNARGFSTGCNLAFDSRTTVGLTRSVVAPVSSITSVNFRPFKVIVVVYSSGPHILSFKFGVSLGCLVGSACSTKICWTCKSSPERSFSDILPALFFFLEVRSFDNRCSDY